MPDRSSNRRMIGTLVFMLIGPILWALQLMLTYGAQSSLCAFAAGSTTGGSNPAASWTVIALTGACMILAATAMLIPSRSYRLVTGAEPPPEQRNFLVWTMRALTALSLLAMLYAGLGAAFLPACAQVR